MSRSIPQIHLSQFDAPVGLARRAVRQWSAASQQTARRNAMWATNAAHRAKVERDDVRDFLAALQTQTTAPAPAVPETHSAHG